MKKIYLIITLLFLTNCAYKPLVDTSGRSGTFNKAKAEELTNDLQHCDKIGKDNSNFISNLTYWSFSKNMDTKYEALVRKCLSNRGHSVLN
jgi:hypothetical protein